jgi:hypothetical protein
MDYPIVTSMFVGPTCSRVELGALNTEGVNILPPVRPGDLDKLVSEAQVPGVIVIVDGDFYKCLSLGQLEIRQALQGGWKIWGLSGFGALRAYELRHFGMVGYGRVYERLCRQPDLGDGEVLGLGSTKAPYEPISEALINFEEALRDFTSRGITERPVAEDILAELSRTWFGGRTLPLFESLLSERAGLAPFDIAKLIAEFEPFRLGRLDFGQFLSDPGWRR